MSQSGSNGACSSSQFSCSSPSWMDDEKLCCESGTESCQLAPWQLSKSDIIYMPFCCSKSGSSPCLNLVHGEMYHPLCPASPPHRSCNHNANIDGRFRPSWCCPEAPGVYCGQVYSQCLYANPLGDSTVSNATTTTSIDSSGSGSSSSTSIPTYAITSPLQQPASTNVSTPAAKAGLSTAAKAGIATSAVVVVSLAVVGLALFALRRKYGKAKGASAGAANDERSLNDSDTGAIMTERTGM